MTPKNQTEETIETARQVTEETAKCVVCQGDIPFDRAAPVVPQPEDTPSHKMTIMSASAVLAGKEFVCDVQCLDVYEEAD